MSLISTSPKETPLPTALEPAGGNDTQAPDNRAQHISLYRLVLDKLCDPVARPFCLEIYDWILRILIALVYLCLTSPCVFGFNSTFCQDSSFGTTSMYPSIYFSLSISVSEFVLSMCTPLKKSPHLSDSPINPIILRLMYAGGMSLESRYGPSLYAFVFLDSWDFLPITLLCLISFRRCSVFLLKLMIAFGKDFGVEFIEKEFTYSGTSVK